MNRLSIIVYLLLTLLLTIGLNFLTNDNDSKKKSRTAFVLTNLKYQFAKKNEDDKIDEIFHHAGLKINKYTWNIFRYLTLFLIVFIAFLNYFFTRVLYTNYILIALVLFLISAPILKIGKNKSFFLMFMEILGRKFEYKKDIEIYSVVIQLKNIAISQKNNPLGAIYIFENIIKFTDVTKPIFNKALSFINLNKKETAKDYLIENLDTELGKDLTYLLMKLGDLNPFEIVKQLELLEERARNGNFTKKLIKTENISVYLSMIPLALVSLIFINFILFVSIDSFNLINF